MIYHFNLLLQFLLINKRLTTEGLAPVVMTCFSNQKKRKKKSNKDPQATTQSENHLNVPIEGAHVFFVCHHRQSQLVEILTALVESLGLLTLSVRLDLYSCAFMTL